MKTKLLRLILPLLITALPQLLSAQWSLVRFDEHNYFTRIAATTPNSAIVAGIDGLTNGSFILRTNDAGASWDSIPLNSTGTNYSIMELHFTDVFNGFAGGVNSNNQALLKTIDNGTTWIDISPDPSLFEPVSCISFVDPGNGYASDGTHLYKTINGGSSWSTAIPGFGIKDLSFLDMNTGYACGESTLDAVVMKTTDGGLTWNQLLTATIPFFASSSMQKLDVVTPDVVYCSGQYSNVLYRTVNSGITWDTITLPQIYSIQDFDFVNALEGHVLSTMGEIYGTVDGGLNWTLEYSVAGGAYGPSIFLVSISFAGTTGYVCGSSGLIKKYTVGTTGFNQPGNHAISIYPNPVAKNEELIIADVSEVTVLEIYNALAQLVVKRQLPAGTHHLYLPVASGIYTLLLTDNKNTVRQKLIITD